jgi:hypothetical protein
MRLELSIVSAKIGVGVAAEALAIILAFQSQSLFDHDSKVGWRKMATQTAIYGCFVSLSLQSKTWFILQNCIRQ